MSSELQTREAQQDKGVALIQRMQPQIAKLVGTTFASERFVRCALTEFRRIPKLAECMQKDWQSVAGAFMQCASLRLEPGVNGQCWVLPFAGKATFVLGYLGLIELLYRSDRVADIKAGAVYDGEEWDFYEDDDGPHFRHRPSYEVDADKLTHVWARIRTTTGGRIVGVMQRAEVDVVMRRAPSAKSSSSPWSTDYVAMAMKTVLKRTAKWAPKSDDASRAIAQDDLADVGREQPLPEVDITPQPEPDTAAPEVVNIDAPMGFGATPDTVWREVDPKRLDAILTAAENDDTEEARSVAAHARAALEAGK